MQNLKYYVLGKKDSSLLEKYLEKYYKKLISDLREIGNKGILKEKIYNLLNTENKKFILNADISSIINFIFLEKVKLEKQYVENYLDFEKKLEEQIDIFLENGIRSEKLSFNKGYKIAGTNIRLTDIDSNPYNSFEAHPEHSDQGAITGNWGEKTQQEWLNIYEDTFNLLKELDLGIYGELNQIITKIVPLGTAKGMHNSCSYKECMGHLYMGYTIDSGRPEINNLEAIIHESSHNKLNLLLQFDPIVLNNRELKYYSAIRPDARHIHGVFLGYHAFAPTMYIIMKAYNEGRLGTDKNWLEKIVLYYMKTKFLQKVIKKYAILTELGKEIAEEIDYVIGEMDILLRKIGPSKDMIVLAKKRQIEHFSEVNKNYPFLEY